MTKANSITFLNEPSASKLGISISIFHFYSPAEAKKALSCTLVRLYILPSFRTSKMWFLFSKFRLPQPNIMELNFALTVLQLCPCTNGNIADFFISLPQNADQD